MKKLYILFLCVLFSSCVFETKNDLDVTIVNNSKAKVYVGEAYYGCDSCGIMKDVRLYCTHGNDTTFFSLSCGGDDPNQETHRFNPANMGSTFTETGGVLDGKAVLDPRGALKTPLKESISIMWSHTKTSFF